MKKALLPILSCLALIAVCSNSATASTDKYTKQYIGQRIEQMQTITDMQLVLSPEFYELEHRAENLPDFQLGYRGFDWTGKVFDVCDPEHAKVRNVDIKILDSNHANAEMTYFDPGCYSLRYKVHLLFVHDEWMIDDVTWMNDEELSGSEREMAYQYINETALTIANEDPDVLMGNLNDLAPDWQYDNEDFIYRNNPQAVNDVIESIKLVKNFYQAGANYTPELGKKIDALISRIRTDAIKHGVKL